MTFNDILHKFRSESFTQKDKGTQFERLMRSWLLSDPRYSNLTKVWLWDDFPSRADLGGKDTGIDLVARTEEGDYWAIQCKCYKEDSVIDKPAVDSFLATSSRQFKDPETLQTTSFAKRMWISTTNHWGKNAEDAIQNQNPPFNRVGLVDLQNSPVDWQLLIDGLKGKEAMLPGKQPREHQLRAMSAAHAYFQEHDRGKLIMACGTGKTYTALKIAEDLLNNKGLVLFMVPSISLLGQSLNAWCADAVNPIKGICICSDSRASRKIKKDFDDTQDSVVDLAVPATTNPKSIAKQLKLYRNHNGLTVVFSTYQSIEAIHAAQHEILKETAGTYGKFDLIVCDEAHRTTGVKLSDRDESNFTKIHDAEYIKGNKRLYMTATPRLYGQSAKIKASEKDAILCSMDDPKLYGEEFFRVNFSYAVEHGLLTDYKVLVLTVNEDDLPDNILSDIKDPNNVELNFDDTSKLIGIVNGLSKIIRGDKHATWDADPTVMHRAIAFCSAIGNNHSPGTSVNTAEVLPTICEKYRDSISTEEREHVVEVQARHIDGSMNSQARNEQLAWLADENIGENECRVLTNVRCLSEGIDVPALDAVLFLSSRNSQVDVVQSVGRVMRNFRKGQPDEKKYGYIIIPIVVPSDVKPEDALNNNTYFSTVWSILNALRSHDDHFNAEVNKIALNKNRTSKVVVGGPGIGHNAISDKQDQQDAQHIEDAEVARQLQLRFGEMQSGIYAKLVEKCGDRLYWENWSKKVGLIAKKFIERISKLVSTVPAIKSEFDIFVKGLQNNLNPSVDEGQAIEMLAQHLISQPVFDALFADYNFVNNNAVSHSMHKMIEQLETVGGFEKDTTELESFYESVRVNVGNIDNLEGKQTIIKNLYEKFFKGAFPLTVEKLGIVYTPVECVDFIIHSVNDILKREFNTSLSDENVHILDPFTGTGTFITRLLQSGLIKPEDMERKYRNEIHCNEIVLLAYYIADVNIEAVYHDLMKPDHYVNYDGICLTDTFQLAETKQQSLSQEFFKENSEGVLRQKKAPIRVIIGNPPYSIGQKSANDNAANMTYPVLDKRVSDTYAAKSSANLTIVLQSDALLQLTADELTTVAGNMTLIGTTADEAKAPCEQMYFPKLQRIDGTLTLSRFDRLSGLGTTFGVLTQAGALRYEHLALANTFEFPLIETTGNITVTDCPILRSVLLPALTDAGSLEITGCPAIETLSFPKAERFDGDVSLATLPAIKDFGEFLPALKAISGDLSIDDLSSLEGVLDLSGCTFSPNSTLDLRLVAATRLTELRGGDFGGSLRIDASSLTPQPEAMPFEITGFKSLDTLRIAGFTHISALSLPTESCDDLTIENCGSQAPFTLSLPNLVEVRGTLLCRNCGKAGEANSASFPRLRNIGRQLSFYVGASSFTALEFPLLETIGNGEPVSDDPADDYALYTMPSGCAGEFILPSLQRVNGSMLVSTWNTSTDRAVAFRFPSLQSVAGEISVGHTAYKNRSVATLDFSALTAAGAIRIGNLSSVTDFSTFTQVLPRLSEQTWSVTDCGYNPTYQQMLDGETGAESK